MKTVIPNSYALNTPASPHFAAERDGITIDLTKIIEPKIIIWSLKVWRCFVPLNSSDVIDLIQPDYVK
jgi:dethiobiotin synthetase